MNIKIILPSIFLCFLATSCGNKVSQCQQIIKIANRVVTETKDLTLSDRPTENELNNWLNAAKILGQASQKIKSLNIKDAHLVNYQDSFADIYKTNSEATYEIVEAIKNRDIAIVKTAQEKVKKAGKLEQEIGTKFNNYCQQDL
jgi:ribosomal protein L18